LKFIEQLFPLAVPVRAFRMKYLRVVIVVFASALCIARAQDDQQERQRPPTEIPDFSNLDEYIYEPKSTVKLGFRHITGAKADFFGRGTSFIAAPEDPGPATGANLTHQYHDGNVNADTRTTPAVDSSGNPMIDPQTGAPINVLISPDGRTNSWNYTDQRQLTDPTIPSGFIAFHSYSAEVVDTTRHAGSGRSSTGLDLTVAHDMGSIFHTRVAWRLMAGMSINDISAKAEGNVAANVSTITDLYNLYGVVPPDAPYQAPSTTTQPVLDANGNQVTGSDGTAQSVAVDTTVLLGNEPTRLPTKTAASATAVNDKWKVKGAYYTFRAGPEISIPITARLRLEFSAGPALVYAGTNYTVTQTFTPDIGADIVETVSNSAYKLRPGYYADASLQFDLTEKAGFFAGAVYQSASSYTQDLSTTTSHYATKVDLSNQNGLRAGMSVRF
jgi:hypothetical protein